MALKVGGGGRSQEGEGRIPGATLLQAEFLGVNRWKWLQPTPVTFLCDQAKKGTVTPPKDCGGEKYTLK